MMYLRRCVTTNNTKLKMKKINSEVTQETPFFYIPPGPETTFPGSSEVTQETSLIFIPLGPETMWTLRKVNGDYVSRRPEGNFLVTVSWDYQICFWEIKKPEISTGNVPEEATICCQPISDSSCTIDATTIFTGGEVMIWVLMSGCQPVLGGAVNEAAWLPGMSLLATANEDYSLRQQAPVHSQQLQNGHYSLCVRYPWMAVGTTQPPQVHHTFATDGLDGAFRLSDKDSKQSLKAMPAFSTHPIEVWAVRVLHVNPAVIPLENPFWRCRGCHRVVVPKKRAFLNVSTVKYGVNEHGPGSLLIVLDMAVINSNVTSRGGAGASPVGVFLETALECDCPSRPCLGFERLYILNPSIRAYLFINMLE
ncbi:uncharacterized protein LOC113289053 isoform X3 [Papaver somniferum]|uniref:uncharacterized protein LOC113289053 isoform X3 n=1 Tax=Papaver somniferum TaxID=3469 RepID=UPI000E701C35|nr:uncharacterized protein LOC113289053 isoform X3 [Papaver somniferum]